VNAKEEAFVPVTLMLVMESAAAPLLVRVTDCDAVAVPTGDEPKARLVAERVTAGPTPVPASAILCGEPPALSVMVMAAASGPLAVGSKCPWMLQLAPAARFVPQEFPNVNDDAFAPVTAMLVIESAAVPVLVMDTYCDAVAVPTGDEPNARLVVERVTAGPSPVPVKAMLCGDPEALSVIVTAALRAPPVTGAKCPWMLQLAPTATLVPQVFPNANEEASAPVTAMLVMVSVWLPVLVRVTYCDAVAVPIGDEPNERLVVESVTGKACPVPVPLNAMDCGELVALSVMVMAAVKAPVAVGAKCPWIVQLAPTATLVPQLLAKTNDDALAPVTAMLVTDNAAVPELVSVTDWEPLDEPTFTEPKERLVADSVTGGSTPVPLNEILCGEPAALSVIVIAAASGPPAAGAKCP